MLEAFCYYHPILAAELIGVPIGCVYASMWLATWYLIDYSINFALGRK
jgi:hypothetical protein